MMCIKYLNKRGCCAMNHQLSFLSSFFFFQDIQPRWPRRAIEKKKFKSRKKNSNLEKKIQIEKKKFKSRKKNSNRKKKFQIEKKKFKSRKKNQIKKKKDKNNPQDSKNMLLYVRTETDRHLDKSKQCFASTVG